MKTILSKKTLNYFSQHWTLYLMLLLPVTFFIVFRYLPIANILVAFKNYNITRNVWDMDWAANNGFAHFITAFNTLQFRWALRNTIILNLLDLVVGFPAPIILALLLNELKFKKFKRVTQTIAYLPHFLSWIIVSGMAVNLFAPSTGTINIILGRFGIGPIPFLNDSVHWVATYVVLGVWKSVGWNTIIYLAAITAVNPELYEAAEVDGAGRFRKMWHITLPGIRHVIALLIILSLGSILGSEFDRPFSMMNTLVRDVATTISIFVYQHGILGLRFSLTSAVGLFQNIVGLIFLLTANTIAKKLGERGLF